EATTVLAEGHVRITLPDAWFPARIDGGSFTAYQVKTGHDDDVFGIYVGNAPSFHSHAGEEFRFANGPALVRGTLWREGTRQRLEALAHLPCETPQFVHFWIHTDAPDRFARMVTALRSVRLESSF